MPQRAAETMLSATAPSLPCRSTMLRGSARPAGPGVLPPASLPVYCMTPRHYQMKDLVFIRYRSETHLLSRKVKDPGKERPLGPWVLIFVVRFTGIDAVLPKHEESQQQVGPGPGSLHILMGCAQRRLAEARWEAQGRGGADGAAGRSAAAADVCARLGQRHTGAHLGAVLRRRQHSRADRHNSRRRRPRNLR